MSEEVRRFNRYSKYKDSGVEWLGEIPAHWRVVRFRATVTGCQNGVWGDEPDGVNDIPCVRVADFDRTAFRVSDVPTFRSIDPKVVATRRLSAGDLLLEKSGGGENQTVGVVVLYDRSGLPEVSSNFIARMPVANGFDSRFLTYVHAAAYALGINTRSIKQSTGIQNLDSDNYLREIGAFPELCEQRLIAKFLDHETARIDALVAKKERLIELLNEKRSALVTHVAMKGLSPGVPMKDAGLNSMDTIPEHWEVRRLRRISPRLGVGVVVNPSTYVSIDGVPFLYGSDVVEGEILAHQARRISPESSHSLPKSQLHAGDLVMVRVGAPGVTAVVPPELEGANCASMLVIRGSETFNSTWLCYALNSRYIRSQVEVVQYGAAQEQFNVRHAVNFVVAVPPLAEQERITVYLNETTARLDQFIKHAKAAMMRLYDLRTALIFAAVTGKIDVREEVA